MWKKIDTLRGVVRNGQIDGISPEVWLEEKCKKEGLNGKKVLLILKVRESK